MNSASSPLDRSLLRNRLHWLIAGLLGLVALVLGFVGFDSHLRAQGGEPTFYDVFYRTLQLFPLNSGSVDGDVGWPLEVARFLAPAVAAYAVARAILAAFSEQIGLVRLRWWRGHVVICGLGRKGARLVQELRRNGKQVVVIESNEINPDLAGCRSLGAVVLLGNAHDRLLLKQARITRARSLIAVTGDDGRNVETAVMAHALSHNRTGPPLKCVIHVVDPSLVDIFKKHHIFAEASDSFELDFFNFFEIGARVMIYEGGNTPVAPAPSGQPPHLLIVGFGRLGKAVLTRAVKDWRIEQGTQAGLACTIIDRDARAGEHWIRVRYPTLLDNCHARFLDLDVRSPEFSGAHWLGQEGRPAVTHVFICLDDDALATLAALSLHRHLSPRRVSFTVRMSEEVGFATLLGTSFQGDGVVQDVRAVGLLEMACTLELVLGGWREVLARSLHQSYLHQQRLQGETPQTNPSMVPWDRLRGELQESNRHEVDGIRDHLVAIGCALFAETDSEINLIEFTENEIDTLARLEHERWCRERFSAGWTFGPKKDVTNRRSPYLCPWRDLSEAHKQYNRDLTRRLPAVLAKVDYEIRRTTDPDSQQRFAEIIVEQPNGR